MWLLRAPGCMLDHSQEDLPSRGTVGHPHVDHWSSSVDGWMGHGDRIRAAEIKGDSHWWAHSRPPHGRQHPPQGSGWVPDTLSSALWRAVCILPCARELASSALAGFPGCLFKCQDHLPVLSAHDTVFLCAALTGSRCTPSVQLHSPSSRCFEAQQRAWLSPGAVLTSSRLCSAHRKVFVTKAHQKAGSRPFIKSFKNLFNEPK